MSHYIEDHKEAVRKLIEQGFRKVSQEPFQDFLDGWHTCPYCHDEDSVAFEVWEQKTLHLRTLLGFEEPERIIFGMCWQCSNVWEIRYEP